MALSKKCEPCADPYDVFATCEKLVDGNGYFIPSLSDEGGWSRAWRGWPYVVPSLKARRVKDERVDIVLESC